MSCSAADLVPWSKPKKLKEATGNYTPVVVLSPNRIRVYGNYDGRTDGSLYVRDGDWKRLGDARVAFPASAITDQAGTPFIRTTAIVRGKSGAYYGLIHVSNGYSAPSVPAWITSPTGDVGTWTYRGKAWIDGQFEPFIYSSSAALIVQEEMPAAVDLVNPAHNRYLAWEDGYGVRLSLVVSGDGTHWFTYRLNGAVQDAWPASLAEDAPVFPSALRTPNGYHLTAANRWPGTALRHLYSLDAVHWCVLEETAEPFVKSAAKGTNLSYDLQTNLVHALTSGEHRSYAEHMFACEGAPRGRKGKDP